MSASTASEAKSHVDPHLHIGAPPIDEKTAELIKQFRTELEAEPIYKDNAYCRRFATDQVLFAYLRARSNDLKKAKKLLLGTLEWRLGVQPELIKPESIEDHQKTGKMVQLHYDRHGRPIWRMDSSRDSSDRSHEKSIHHLFYNLEYCRRRMKRSQTPGVEKYCLFINLMNYSSSNQPATKTSMETLKTLTERYPEHLGTAVLFQPPWLFEMFFKICKPFLDPRTVSKIHFIRGDFSKGSANDKLLTDLIGDDWRIKCEIEHEEKGKILLTDEEKERMKSMKYDHSVHFPDLVEEHREFVHRFKAEEEEQKQKEQQKDNQDKKTENTNDDTAAPAEEEKKEA